MNILFLTALPTFIACLTFCLLLTYGPILALPEYKLKVAKICEMHGTAGIKVLVLSTFTNKL